MEAVSLHGHPQPYELGPVGLAGCLMQFNDPRNRTQDTTDFFQVAEV
jgi:hypothetical protein